MGRIYLEHLGGSKVFVCAECNTFLTNNNELYSNNIRGNRGSAYLFKKVVNVTYSESTKNNYKHFVKDVFCKKCNTNLGSYYEFVPNESIRYLEGKIILEKSTVRQENGMQESKSKPKLCSEDKPDQEYRDPEIIDSDSKSDSDSDFDSACNSDSEDEGRDETG